MSAPSATRRSRQPKPNSFEVSVRSSRDFEAEVANANRLTGQGANRLQNALTPLGDAMREANADIEEIAVAAFHIVGQNLKARTQQRENVRKNSLGN
jgi:hypothetical protein